jgi:hypothetical protein
MPRLVRRRMFHHGVRMPKGVLPTMRTAVVLSSEEKEAT